MRNQSGRRLPNYAIGLIMVVVLAIASYVAFTKQVPWGGGTEFKAVFNSAQNLRPNSPVRIAGVEVGKVTAIEPVGGDIAPTEEGEIGAVQSGALVTMELDEDGLPLHEDAQFKLRPRLFLEGNLFVELRPGSPAAPVVDPDYTFPPQQTSNTVQLDEILTGVLQADTRANLQVFLDQFGKALIDEGGAKSLQVLNRASPDAFKFTSQVNQALLGENPHDLSELIGNLDRVIRGLGRNEGALQGLVTNLRITTGSFAAQDVALERAIAELPNTLDAGQNAFASLNESFPPTRAFAREALPGVRTTPETLAAATPLLRQLRLLAQPSELRGLVADLRPAVPDLAKLTRETIPFLKQTRALSSCFNNVILPWANDRISSTNAAYNADHGSKGRVFEETGYGLAGIAGESRSGDANGQYIRVIGGGGTNTVQSFDQSTGENLAGVTPFPLDGSMPRYGPKTPFKPEKPCENQDPPNLVSSDGGPPPQEMSDPATGTNGLPVLEDSVDVLEGLSAAATATQENDPEAEELQEEAQKDLENLRERYGS